VGTKFFAPKQFTAPGLNLQARAQGAGSYAGRADATGAAKDIAAAQALYKAHAAKPMTRGAAYPKVNEKV
jgi:hypothetical protein